MDEYIKREAAIERLKKNLYASNPDSFSYLCFQDAINSVQEIPAADVEPVRHGRWKLIGADKRSSGSVWKCTGRDGCGRIYPYKCDFCPNCGARMDEEEDHGN